MSDILRGGLPVRSLDSPKRRHFIQDLPQDLRFKESETSCYPQDLCHGVDLRIIHQQYRKSDRPNFAVPGNVHGKVTGLESFRNCAIEVANTSDTTCRGYGSLNMEEGGYVRQSYITESQHPSVEITIFRDLDENGKPLRKPGQWGDMVDASRRASFRIFASHLAQFDGTVAISINGGDSGKGEMLKCINADSSANTALREEVVKTAEGGRLWMTQLAIDAHYTPTARHNWLGIEDVELQDLVRRYNEDPAQLTGPDTLIAELARGVKSIRLYAYMLGSTKQVTHGQVWYKLRDYMYAVCQMSKMVGNCWFYRMLEPSPFGNLRAGMATAPWPRWITQEWSVDEIDGQYVDPQPSCRAPFGMSYIWPDLETQTVMSMVWDNGRHGSKPVLYDHRANQGRGGMMIFGDKSWEGKKTSERKKPHEARKPLPWAAARGSDEGLA